MRFVYKSLASADRLWRNKAIIVALCAALVAASLLVPLGPTVGSKQAHAATSVPMLFGSAPDAPDSQLQAIVEDTVSDLGGTWGVAVKKLDTGQYAVYNGDKQQVSASLYKMWVLNELFRQVETGEVSLDDYGTVTGDDAYYDSLLGDQSLAVGESLTLRSAANAMITVSDNTAAHLLVRTLGPDNVNAFMQENGLTHSLLDWSGVGDNLTTPLDMLREMELIATSQMVDAPSSNQMVQIMLGQQINNLIPVGLPDDVPFAHKTGSLDGLLHDAGIIYGPSGPFILVVMTSDLDSYSTAYDNVPLLASRIYKYFNSRDYSPAMYFPQTRETVGHDFLKFWNVYGGKDAFGYPIGPERMADGVLVQDFERARFEWHPDAAKSGDGAVPGVVLSNLGQIRAQQLGLQWQPGPDPGNGTYFKETGQSIQGGFLEYWTNNGGERVFGLPISPEVQLTSSVDGKTYTMQYFQKARMEYHPELPVGHRVVLGNLGTEIDNNP